MSASHCRSKMSDLPEQGASVSQGLLRETGLRFLRRVLPLSCGSIGYPCNYL